MRRGPRFALFLLLALVVVLLCGGDAALADGMLPEQPLSAGDTIASTLAMAPNGWAAVAWVDYPVQTLEYSVRPPGGAWSAPAPLGTRGLAQEQPTIAVDARGDLAVAWVEQPSPTLVEVQVVSRPAGGVFTGQEAIANANVVRDPQLGIDAAGGVTLAYSTDPGLDVRAFPAGGSALAARPNTLTSATCFLAPGDLAVAPGGDAVLGTTCRGAAFALRHGGRWTFTPPVPDTGGGCGGTQSSVDNVAIGSQGEAVGLVRSVTTTPSPLDQRCMLIGAGKTIAEQLAVPQGGALVVQPGTVASGRSPPDLVAYNPVSGAHVGIGAEGVLVAWNAFDGTSRTTQTRGFAADGFPLGPAQTLDTPLETLGLAVGADGRALLAGVPASAGLDGGALVAETRPPGGAFASSGQPADDVPATDGAFGVALDAGGDGAIAYTRGAPPSTPPLFARGFDAAPPTLDDVRIPAGADATPGAPLAFAASATDVWGPVSLAWSFGDGTGASGGTATHAYAATGTYTATVTATDAAGNTASRSGVVHVGGGIGGGGGGGGDRADAPTLSHVSLSYRAFRVGRGRTAVSARRRRARSAPAGTTFRFTLDAAANVRIAFARSAPGRRSGRHCARPSRRLARARRCTRSLAAGSLTRSERAGADAVAFSGRVGRRALAPGSYRATLTASAGGRAGAPRTLGFRVVR